MVTEDETDPLNGHESEQTPGDSEDQGRLACCSPWGHKESDTAWRLNSNNNVTELYKELGNVLCISQYNFQHNLRATNILN